MTQISLLPHLEMLQQYTECICCDVCPDSPLLSPIRYEVPVTVFKCDHCGLYGFLRIDDSGVSFKYDDQEAIARFLGSQKSPSWQEGEPS